MMARCLKGEYACLNEEGRSMRKLVSGEASDLGVYPAHPAHPALAAAVIDVSFSTYVKGHPYSQP